MPNKRRKYFFNAVLVVGTLVLMNEVRSTLERVFSVDLSLIRWSVWLVGAAVIAVVIRRGFIGFRDGEFLFDD